MFDDLSRDKLSDLLLSLENNSKFISLRDMNKSISIDKLSTAEKIELMEKLWSDLSASADYSPPAWHGEELARRKNAVKEGKATYTNWEQAKKEIRDELK